MKKLLTLLLSLLMVVSLGCVNVFAQDTGFGTIKAYGTSGLSAVPAITAEATISGAGTSSTTITVNKATLQLSEKDESIGRYRDCWWMGFLITAPSNAANIKYDYSTDADSLRRTMSDTEKAVWIPLTDASLQKALAKADKTITYTMHFDWDGNDTADQTFNIKIDASNIILQKNGEDFIKTTDGTLSAAESANSLIKSGETYPTYYSTLAAAVADADDGSTIKLLGDCSGETVTVNNNITLNMNGQATPTINVTDGKKLTVQGASDGSKITGTTGSSKVFDNNNGASEDTFDESGDNEFTVDQYYTLYKAAGTDDGTIDYYVTVSWETTDGTATAKGDTYHWDASKQMYVRTTEENALSNNTPATAKITVTNYSNAKVNYEVTYASADGYNTTEEKTADSKYYDTLANYVTYLQADGSTIVNEGIENGDGDAITGGTNEYVDGSGTRYTLNLETGAASYTHLHNAPTATYEGKVTLNAGDATKAAFTNQKVGTYTVNITAAPVAKQTVTRTTSESGAVTLTAQPNPAEDSTKNTTVEFPAGAISNESGVTTNLTVDETPVLESVDNASFTVSSSETNKALGAIDLTVKVNGEVVSTFEKPVTVTTYVAKGITDFGFNYDGEAFTVVENKTDVDAANKVWYDSTTGELVFCTTHFSTYVLEGSDVAYIESDNTVYDTLADALYAVTDNQTITVLKDSTYILNDTGSDSSGCDKSLWSAGNNVVLDLNGHKFTSKSNYGGSNNIINLFGNWTIKNGEIVVLRNSNNNNSTAIPTTDENYDTNYPYWDSYAIATDSTDGYENGTLTMENMTMHAGIAAYSGTSVNFDESNFAMGTNFYAIYTESGAVVNVNGGTCEQVDSATQVLFYANSEATININSGSFTGNKLFGTKGTGVINIKGGTFSSDPSSLVTLPYVATKDETTGLWIVAKTNCYSVTYTDTAYVKMDEATFKTLTQTDCYAKSNIDGTFVRCDDDTTKVYSNGTTAAKCYEWAVNNFSFGGDYVFRKTTGEYTKYFATEQEANNFAASYTGAVVAEVNAD